MSTSVVAGLISAAPASAAPRAADEQDTGLYSNSIGEGPRLDRCTAGVALHIGGPAMKAKAIEGLTGTDEQLQAIIGNPANYYAQMGAAMVTDRDSASGYLKNSRERKDALEAANKVYAQTAFSDQITLHAPEFDKSITDFTLGARSELLNKFGQDGHAVPGQAVIDKATALYNANKGKDSWNDLAAQEMLKDAGSSAYRRTTASDLAYYLRHGGYPDTAPEPGTAEFRVEAEALKGAFGACDSLNPVDARRVMNQVVLTAGAEWEQEYASQAAPRATIIKAESDASRAAVDATDAMIDSVGQAWLAEQILLWQKYWADKPADDILRPAKSVFDKAAKDLAKARTNAAAAADRAIKLAAAAKTASTSADGAQTEAYKIADARHEPRGRGLSYAQQSVQVAKASAAAAEATSQAAQTASNAAKATAKDTATLLKLAQTKAHAVNTEFRRAAAEEAARQAKAAADSAESYANKAAANATTAKNAQKTAAEQKEIARKEAENAAAKATTAELERANAAAYRATAASERSKAETAEKKAEDLKGSATSARGDADSAADTASAKRIAAERAEADAEFARDQAYQAEQQKKAYEARAAALESAAAAAEGTDAAADAKKAATDARTAADQAAHDAAGARQAADDATTAAVNARTAATKAKSSAIRSRKAADDAWNSYWGAFSAAQTAHAAAAEAIDASKEAAANAKKAGEEAAKAKEQAKIAHDNAVAAHDEALKTAKSAAETVGEAYATTQAALAARDSADKARAPANTAISMGTAYQETDSAAAFAVLAGQQSLTYAEQEAKAAEAKSAEAQRMAKEAQALADKASKDDKAAATASAQAAKDASRAATAYRNAQASAQEARTAAVEATKLADEADGYAVRAGGSAVNATLSANSAEAEAAAADNEATQAEKSAAGARQAAKEATDQADAADFSARRAASDAAGAQDAADNANQAASDAQKAAARAEEEERKRVEAERRKAMESGDTGVTGTDAKLTADDRALLLKACGQTCVDQWDQASAAVAASVIDWIKKNGADVLIEVIGVNDAKRCFGKGDVESCLWTAVNAASFAVLIGKLPAVTKAIAVIASKIGKFFEEAEWGKRTLDQLRKVIEAAKKEPDKGSIGKSSTPCEHPGAESCKNITFPDKNRPELGSDGKYHLKEGDTEKQIDNPNDLSDTIGDIDVIKDGVLWENKTVTARKLTDEQLRNWVRKHVGKKVDSYRRARPFLKGYEGAPIGIRFEDPAINTINPGLKSLVEERIRELRQANPDLDIRFWWPQ
ncbi:hypothetical protein [Streptomyces sp. TP-A0356]|uniref:hypothetical protein n=1 Tax=Streptomyces sp. TP-A0356 TaxID=1359208 RepID=UPI00131E86BA|nr:hypothetical protein [Streptomyces sp. TP-A0356]